MRHASAANQKDSKANSSAGARKRLRLWLVCILVFAGWAGYVFYSQASEMNDKSKQLTVVRSQEKAKQDSLNDVKYEINRLNDPEYIGQLARKKYGLYKPGETPIRKSNSGD
ncbi:FtsB family cell division protein [Paenibacillus pinistramenti]|uniref:FtsB family cell division protein n=1 Tax=Paenibacillus pinistramenti TaxID=1768003 RepID=UPI0011098CC6|nr:septum formation initiator family protein [Paenibacillus pinistramenti]